MAVEETGPRTPDSEWAAKQDDDISLLCSALLQTNREPVKWPPSSPLSNPCVARRPSHQTIIVWAGQYSTPNLSSATHPSDNICSSCSSCDLGRRYPRARSPKIWPREEGALRVAWVVDGTLFSCPISFLILRAPGKGKQQEKHSSPSCPRAMTKPSLGTSHCVFTTPRIESDIGKLIDAERHIPQKQAKPFHPVFRMPLSRDIFRPPTSHTVKLPK